jgi:RimJ/RimL family protein N-acetyltransferase
MSDEPITTEIEAAKLAADTWERLLALRDGRYALLRPALPEDAHNLLDALNEVAGEGRFLLRRAWQITPELEQRWLRVAMSSVDLLIVAVLLDSAAMRHELDLAGSLSLVRGRPEFIRHTAELSMWLRPAYREQGLGSAMLQYGVDWAHAQHDLEKITLSVRSSNRRAQNLYMKYGFVEEGRRRGYIKTDSGYEDEVLLSRFVAGPLAVAPSSGHEPARALASADEESDDV